MYKDVAKNIEIFNIQFPKTIVPSPTENDYNLGFIRRYFIRRINDENGFIFEIDENEYQKYLTNPFFESATIKWRISGPIEIKYKDNGEIDDKGVKNSNKTAINIASEKLKNIGLYLPNILQFYK